MKQAFNSSHRLTDVQKTKLDVMFKIEMQKCKDASALKLKSNHKSTSLSWNTNALFKQVGNFANRRNAALCQLLLLHLKESKDNFNKLLIPPPPQEQTYLCFFHSLLMVQHMHIVFSFLCMLLDTLSVFSVHQPPNQPNTTVQQKSNSWKICCQISWNCILIVISYQWFTPDSCSWAVMIG